MPVARSLAESFESEPKVSVTVDAALEKMDSPTDNQIPDGVRLVVYRIVEEALNNASRHGEAKSVHIAMAIQADGQLFLIVTDDGASFAPKNYKSGLGMNSIAARVGQVNSTWRISSEKGKGATLTAVLPFTMPVSTGG